ncbi:hypothetical protein MHYP_G00251180 [Metynnis hypsauchen]
MLTHTSVQLRPGLSGRVEAESRGSSASVNGVVHGGQSAEQLRGVLPCSGGAAVARMWTQAKTGAGAGWDFACPKDLPWAVLWLGYKRKRRLLGSAEVSQRPRP